MKASYKEIQASVKDNNVKEKIFCTRKTARYVNQKTLYKGIYAGKYVCVLNFNYPDKHGEMKMQSEKVLNSKSGEFVNLCKNKG